MVAGGHASAVLRQQQSRGTPGAARETRTLQTAGAARLTCLGTDHVRGLGQERLFGAAGAVARAERAGLADRVAARTDPRSLQIV